MPEYFISMKGEKDVNDDVTPVVCCAHPAGAADGRLPADCAAYPYRNPTHCATPVPRPVVLGEAELTAGEIDSQALAGNLLGDPATRTFFVLLPPSYNSGDKRYPVVFVLPSIDGQARTDAWDSKNALEALLHKGEIGEMILVMPDGSNSLGGSQFRSSPTIGDYETYITQELVDYVDSHYRTIPTRESRGIMGCASGGDATMRLALKYPDVYSVAAPSGGSYDEALETNAPLLQELERLKKLPQEISDIFLLYGPETGDFAMAAWYIQAAAGTAPNPDNPPLYLDMPFRIVDGHAEIVPEVAAQIAEHDSAHEVQRYLQQPLRLRGILIQHALHDYDNPTEIVRGFHELLTELGIEHEYIETESVEEDRFYCVNPWEPAPLKFLSDHLEFEAP